MATTGKILKFCKIFSGDAVEFVPTKKIKKVGGLFIVAKWINY
jgi:hypothetical protein